MVKYGETPRATTSFWLYETYKGKYPPKWFEFDAWRDFKAYIVEKEKRDYYGVWLLLYHEDIGQAYFIEHEVKGRWGARPTHEELRRKSEEKARAMEEAFGETGGIPGTGKNGGDRGQPPILGK